LGKPNSPDYFNRKGMINMAAGDTNFNELTVKELHGVATQFGVDLDGITKKADIITELGDLGVTWELYTKALEAAEEASRQAEEDAGYEEELDPVFEPETLVDETPQVVVVEQPVVVPVAVEPEPVMTREQWLALEGVPSMPAARVSLDAVGPVLIKMTRPNFSYEIRGYKFTKQHPYVLVEEDDADYLIETDGGFRLASPKELRDFYGA
jgi:hypothetical protein